jgi:uncharacterized protein YigE (DUF2233 family)
MAVLGVDKDGNVMLIFTEAPYSAHDFINILLSLPVSIYNAMYLEGGSLANLYLSTSDIEIERIGIYGSEVGEEQFRTVARPVPNIIGITRKRGRD